MENPAWGLIAETIETGSVYYFEEEKLSSKEPHYFVVLNRNPRTDAILLLVCASSQVEKRQRIGKALRFSEKTLVVITPAEYTEFTKETIIDCNRVFEKSIQSLADKLQKKQLRMCEAAMSQAIIQKLTAGVLASDLISENVRKMLLGI